MLGLGSWDAAIILDSNIEVSAVGVCEGDDLLGYYRVGDGLAVALELYGEGLRGGIRLVGSLSLALISEYLRILRYISEF
ncbi:hypothetical protein ACULPM_08160 [Thermophilibacter sp. ZX-H3]|uniref:hypothetical protein n=1 Tax=unclassified Thermophilibacter TaxID=2847308 RepID=UPI0040407ACC